MNLLGNIIQRYPLLKNRYMITFTIFLAWIMFFDRNNMIDQFHERNTLFILKKEKRYYQKEISSTKEDLTALLTSNSHLEKYAREKFRMRKDNEEIWLVIDTAATKIK
jgi:uncharacterized protein YpmS